MSIQTMLSLSLQLRLDFANFVITGPTLDTATVSERIRNSGLLGTPNPAVAVGEEAFVSALGQCQTDTFSVSNPDGPSPPTICGVNTREHSE